MSTSTPARPAVSAGAERRYRRMRAFTPGDADAGWPILLICEGLARSHRLLDAMLRHDGEGSGLRRAHSPSRAPVEYLPRLANIAGVELKNQTETQLRREITVRPRTRRCSRPALVDEVTPTLAAGASDQDIRVVERWEGDPFQLAVVVAPDLVPDEPATLAAARRHEPLFCLMRVEFDDSVLVGEATKNVGDVADTVTVGNAQRGQV